MGLSFFEDAKQEILPRTFVEYDWDKIKEFFIKFQSEIEKNRTINGFLINSK